MTVTRIKDVLFSNTKSKGAKNILGYQAHTTSQKMLHVTLDLFHLMLFCFNANKPFKPRCHGQNSKQYLNQIKVIVVVVGSHCMDYRLLSSPFLDSREGARNRQAKAENWSERAEGAWGEAGRALLVFFSLLALHSRLTCFRDYLERDC